jgi:hypothetical protein
MWSYVACFGLVRFSSLPGLTGNPSKEGGFFKVMDARVKPGHDEMSSFRDGPKDQPRNLEIPGSMLRIVPG